MGSTPNRLARRQALDLTPKTAALVPGCLAVLAVCGAVGYGAYRFLPQTPDKDPTAPAIFAGIIGVVGGLALSSLWSIARGHGRGAGSRRALHERARTDGGPEDGGPIIATGVVRSERPLISPIGGIPCVAYEYRMYSVKAKSDGAEQVPVYWGYAGQPFALDSRARRYPVASVPFFAWKDVVPIDDAARGRARQYVRSTGWETVEFGMLGTLDTVFRRAGEDSTTGTRKDFALAYDVAPDVALLTLEERVLPLDITASAFGQWSAALGAIVAPEAALGVSAVMLAKGGPEALDGQPGVPQSTTSYVVAIVVALAIAGGLFWVATLVLPTMD